jgi:PRTRC genetic system ThiF family protein
MLHDETLYHYAHPYVLDPTHPLSVALIGAGGTGSQLLTHLGKMHTALRALDHPGLFVTVYDGDTVSEANIGRQMFVAGDIGANKAVTLATRVNRFFGLQWEGKPIFYADKHQTHNIVFTCVDSAKARILIQRHIYEKKVSRTEQQNFLYWIDAGNNKQRGQVVMGTGTHSPYNDTREKNADHVAHLPHVIDLFPDIEAHDTEAEQGPSCSLAEALGKQDLLINTMAAAYATHLLWKMLTNGRTDVQGCFFNLDDVRTVPVPVKEWNR